MEFLTLLKVRTGAPRVKEYRLADDDGFYLCVRYVTKMPLTLSGMRPHFKQRRGLTGRLVRDFQNKNPTRRH